MTKYNIVWSEYAGRRLKKLPTSIARNIYKRVEELADDPFSKNIKKLKGLEYYRIRVGDYRVLFDIENKVFRILVINVAHRKKAYKELKWLK